MAEEPWFRRTDDPLPFRLSKKISVRKFGVGAVPVYLTVWHSHERRMLPSIERHLAFRGTRSRWKLSGKAV